MGETDQAYIFTPLARADLEEIWFYTAKEWSVNQADRYIETIFGELDKAASGAVLARPIHDSITDHLKITVGSHFAIIRKESKPLKVIRILHRMRDIENALKDV